MSRVGVCVGLIYRSHLLSVVIWSLCVRKMLSRHCCHLLAETRRRLRIAGIARAAYLPPPPHLQWRRIVPRRQKAQCKNAFYSWFFPFVTASNSQSPISKMPGKRSASPKSNGDCIAESPKKSPPLDLRLPLEMKVALVNGRPVLRATCEITAGHIWGPYRLAALRRCTSPCAEERSPLAHTQIRFEVGSLFASK